MKIAILSRYQNEIQRGAETFVLELSSCLCKNHSIDILVGNDADSLSKILAGKYDIVFSINGGLQSFKASIGRIFGGYKLIIPGQAGIGRGDIWNIAFTMPNIYVALTDYMKNWAKKWAWNSKVVKINNGVDLDKFNKIGKKININLVPPVILSVGALEWYKGHHLTIEAISRLGKASLLIVGDGAEKGNLEMLGRKKLGSKFKIIQVKYEDLPSIYRSVDLFTLPSWDREAFGIVYLEALACGLGVVAPDDSSRREIIGDAGLFVNVEDIAAYADSIRKALDVDWEDRPRKQAEKFSWDKISDQYENLIIDLR